MYNKNISLHFYKELFICTIIYLPVSDRYSEVSKKQQRSNYISVETNAHPVGTGNG